MPVHSPDWMAKRGNILRMRCNRHELNEAFGVCAYCGRAVCGECASCGVSQPLTCSPVCAEQLSLQRSAIQSLSKYCEDTRRASATYYFLSAGLSAGGAIAAWFVLPLPFLIWFAGGCAVVLAITGFRHYRFGGQKAPTK